MCLAIREDSEHQRLHFRNRLVLRVAVGQASGNFWRFSDPATVCFLFHFDSHGSYLVTSARDSTRIPAHFPIKNTSKKNQPTITAPTTILIPIPARVPTTEPTPEIAA